MFNVDAHTRVYISGAPLDFRRQIDGLALAVQETLELDPLSSHLFVFTNRLHDKLKLLYWHHNGFILVYKRLEKNTFCWPSVSDEQPLCVGLRELQCLIEGGDIQQLAPLDRLKFSAV